MIGYRVYIIKDPTKLWNGGPEPIYVGMSNNDERAKSHLRRKDRHPLTNRIKRLLRKGVVPTICEIPCYDQKSAFELEMALIKTIGRRKRKTGPLWNLTEGGEGRLDGDPTPGFSGHHHREDSKQQIRNTMRSVNAEYERRTGHRCHPNTYAALKRPKSPTWIQQATIWKMGNKASTGKRWINDGKAERYIDASAQVPDGWHYGRLRVRKSAILTPSETCPARSSW